MNQLETNIKRYFKSFKHNIKNFPDFFIVEKDFQLWLECKQVKSYFNLKRFKKTKQNQMLIRLAGILLIFYKVKRYYKLYDFLKKTHLNFYSLAQVRIYIENTRRLKTKHREKI